MPCRCKSFFLCCFGGNTSKTISFHRAVETWSVERIRKFLQQHSNRVDIEFPNYEGKTILQRLSEKHSRSPEDMQKIDVLLSFGADPLFMMIGRGDYTPKSILFRAFEAKASDLVMKFLPYVDIHKPIENGSNRVPIHCATENGFADILRYLLLKGANIEHQMDDAMTPIHLAMRQPNTDVLKILLQNGADINARNSRGDTTLHWSCYWLNTSEHIDILLSHNVDLTATDNDGRTPLHIYLERKADNPEVCERMLKKGADPNCRTISGKTPLHILSQAFMFNQSRAACEITKLLIKYGASVNAQDADGNTPLHLAAGTLAKSLVTCLLREGANANIVNNTDYTAFSVCTMLGDSMGMDVIRYCTLGELRRKFKFSEKLMDAVTTKDSFRNYLEACQAEMDVLAGHKVGEKLPYSLLDVLKASLNDVATMARNEEMHQAMRRIDLKIYPIYGTLIWENYVAGTRRKRAFSIGAVYLERHLEGVLNYDLWEHVMKFIPTDDLEKWVKFENELTAKPVTEKRPHRKKSYRLLFFNHQ